MVQVDGGDVLACSMPGCSKPAARWRVSWDVTRQITCVSPSCERHAPKPPTRRDVEKWGSHDVPQAVAAAIAKARGGSP